MHGAVFGQSVHAAGFGAAGFQLHQRFGLRHLVDQDLVFCERGFRDAVAGLDDGGGVRAGGGGDAGGFGEEAADGDGVGGVVRALVDHLQHVIGAENGGGDLDAAGAPAIGQRHFAAAEGDLMAGDGDGFEQRAADHALGLLIEIGEIVAGDGGHFVSSRMRRMASSSDWKST